jgi:hypothetical protein
LRRPALAPFRRLTSAGTGTSSASLLTSQLRFKSSSAVPTLSTISFGAADDRRGHQHGRSGSAHDVSAADMLRQAVTHRSVFLSFPFFFLVLLLVPARPTLFFPLRRKLQLPSAERLCTVLGRDCPAAADRPALPACLPAWPPVGQTQVAGSSIFPLAMDICLSRLPLSTAFHPPPGGAGFRIPNSRFPKIARD